ncbi:MAG: DUF2141 domain-containing protein [Sulfuricellaceae bacterium]|nr:DUF2141 domain-containing protein [Sulfuricellaceae bacterium]
MKIKLFYSAIIVAALCVNALNTLAAELEVEVTGVRSAEGQVKLMLFERAEGFRKEDKSREVLVLPATVGTVRGVFSALPPGRYAIVSYHDEDGDGKLKLRFGMFPREGYGLSANPSVSAPPAFKDAAFDVLEAGIKLAIELKYPSE